MSLTQSQLTTLKAAIQSEPAVATDLANGNFQEIADYYNEKTTTNAWRIEVLSQESDEAANYVTFDGLSAGKRDSWSLFLSYPRNFNKNKVRSWVVDIWGSVTANSVSEDILKVGLEKASRAEVLLGGTTKTTGTLSGLDRNWIGTLESNDIDEILRA